MMKIVCFDVSLFVSFAWYLLKDEYFPFWRGDYFGRNSKLYQLDQLSVRPCSVVKYSKVYEKVLAIKSWLPNHAFLQIEYFSSKHRNWPLCFSHTIGKFYEMLLVVTALATRTRAGVHVGIAFLATCALPLFYIHIPESCRWLVSNSRVNKAQEIVVVRFCCCF